MDSAADISVEAQVQRLAALPLPRTLRSSRGIKVLILFLGLVALGSLTLIAKALSQHPRDFVEIAHELVWATAMIGTGVLVYMTPRQRNLLRWGTPAQGRVLNSERRGNATRIAYSFQVGSGIVMQAELMGYRKPDLKKGMPVVVFYDPKDPEYSSILGCKLWDVEFPDPKAGSANQQTAG
jgi:hypothetical protein